ncbi:hypothetical protein HY492_02155 [Candidatus Woesearchaeota archaeon]|nr:hypothetical protein [Candidatus Woesearchaeota archaeon]
MSEDLAALFNKEIADVQRREPPSDIDPYKNSSLPKAFTDRVQRFYDDCAQLRKGIRTGALYLDEIASTVQEMRREARSWHAYRISDVFSAPALKRIIDDHVMFACKYAQETALETWTLWHEPQTFRHSNARTWHEYLWLVPSPEGTTQELETLINTTPEPIPHANPWAVAASAVVGATICGLGLYLTPPIIDDPLILLAGMLPGAGYGALIGLSHKQNGNYWNSTGGPDR